MVVFVIDVLEPNPDLVGGWEFLNPIAILSLALIFIGDPRKTHVKWKGNLVKGEIDTPDIASAQTKLELRTWQKDV